ncbi:MAG: hypothetical protein E5V66_01220 [Mesorhizobium sp.]|uniref:NADH-ubiquinone oxidoreductase-F iron-sulfur binding region domain-containing protein n=1 Tax=Mesorhizobium sp. TaxID=1871066 RepID=UPI001216D1CB|nr:NADH-ubiquinone oxidoreductase-F iron-sulfur binding region domain-containing protein [Mesorhizobium sp.]TIW14144.1 MAG: hypothetical protein E5V66_01220 [Mesorhizobium sp.]
MMDIFSRTAIRAEATGVFSDGEPTDMAALPLAQKMSAEQILLLVERSGLTGKGGANFPTHRKVALMQKQKSGKKHLIINGGEHEPGSQKDRYLLETYPETIVEGALILAHAVNANTIQIAVCESAGDAIAMTCAAIESIASRSQRNKLGDLPSIKVVAVPDSYLVGEESALIATLEGQPSLPRRRPPFPIERGFQNDPTLVHNVETVGHLPFIVAAGPDRYRSLGGAHSSGVTLCTFGPEFKYPGVRLVPLGISLRGVIDDYGGGLRNGQTIKAVQPGGPAAGILTAQELDVAFESTALKQAGSALGCAAIRAFSQGDDIVSYVAQVIAFFAGNSCGQCPSCRMETQMLDGIMAQVMAKKATEKLLNQVSVVIKTATIKPAICSLVQMPAGPILSALQKFPDDFRRYVNGESVVSHQVQVVQ